jgi:hypothetical protein
MTTTSALARGDVRWEYPGEGHSAYVLRAGGEEIGWLSFEERPLPHSTAELGGRRWTIECTGAFHPHIVVRAEGSDSVVAEFTPHVGGGGVVAFASGRRLCWTREHVWSVKWCFRCEENKSAVCVTQAAGPLTEGGRVAVCGSAADLPETPVLILLAWFLRLLEFERLVESICVAG